MNQIAYPLKPDMKGKMVAPAHLQDALQRCVDGGVHSSLCAASS